MALIQCVAFLLMYLAGLTSAQTSQCNANALTTCLQPFQVWGDAFAYGTVTASNITVACSSFNMAVGCVLKTANCPDTDPITMARWLGKKQLDTYVCSATGMNDYLNNQVCLASQSFLLALGGPGGCGLTATGQANTSLSPGDACTSLSNQLTCINAGTQRTCNANTTAFVNKIAPLLLTPAIKAISPSCTGYCNATTLNACLANFSIVSTGFAMSIYNATTLDGACNTYNTMVSCALNQANCSDNDAITMASGWTGKKYVVGQICGPGRTTYLANQPCLATQAFGMGLGNCISTPIAAGLDPNAACRQFNAQLTCIGTASNATCGPSAANFMLSSAPGYLGPAFLLNYPNCVINKVDVVPEKSDPVGGATAHWMNLSLLLASIITTLLI